MKILVADDSIVSRHLLHSTLTGWGYDTVMASDGLQAWEILQQEGAPPVAILDWMMPGLTGLDLCRKIRAGKREPYTYVLLLTAKGSKDDLVQGMDAGADDYVIKPFDKHELNVRLRAGKRLIELQAELLATREALREQATFDALTRLPNRSSILDSLKGEIARAGRELRPIGIILVDLDHFKSVNDTYGHFGGDVVLQEASHRMRDGIRTYDSIGRYGGEEFLILLPGCDEHTTYLQAERLRILIAQEKVSLPGATVSLTASFGCTSAPPGCKLPGEVLIRRADEALYEAKRRGRNRVEFLSSSEEVSSAQVLASDRGVVGTPATASR